ncbi:MAG: hypothetical protein KAS32_26360 [Candidatus Peribacteraceae bacterium]|nr:hypothetical protein [Candidatus Peribacteraceae bacterium]
MKMMKYISQRGPTCIIASLAMVWGCSFDDVVNEIGHDGTEIMFPESNWPEGGINLQEILDAAFNRGLAMNVIEFYPRMGPADGKGERLVYTEEEANLRLRNYLVHDWCVLRGENKQGCRHSVAWDGIQVHDPDIGRYSIADFKIDEVLQFHRIL